MRKARRYTSMRWIRVAFLVFSIGCRVEGQAWAQPSSANPASDEPTVQIEQIAEEDSSSVPNEAALEVDQNSHEGKEDNEGWEEGAEMEEVEQVTAEPIQEVASSGWSRIGKIHPLTIHFPIAWAVLLFLLEGYRVIRPSQALDSIRRPLLVLTLLSFSMALLTGWIRADALEPSAAPEDLEQMASHRNWMFAAFFALVLVSTVFDRVCGNARTGRRWLYLGLWGGVLGLLVYGAHKGGVLVYGSNYLPF